MSRYFTKVKESLVEDFSTKNSEFLPILVKCGIISILLLISCFVPFFVYIALVASVLFILTQLNGRAIYYLAFLMPTMGIFKSNAGSTYMLAYLLCEVLLILAIKLVIEVFIKKTKKINWWFSIIFVITLLYFMLPFTFPDFSISFSLILGLCLVFVAYYYKDDIDGKEIGLMFVFGVLVSIIIGLFYQLSPRMKELISIFYAYGLPRFCGAYTNPNILAGEMMFALAIIYTLVINKKIKAIHYPIIVIFEISLIYSMSKSGLIIFTAITFGFCVLYLIKNHKWKDVLNVSIILFLEGLVLLIFKERFMAIFGRITAAIKPVQPSGDTTNNVSNVIINMEELTTGRSTIWEGYFDAIFDSVKSVLFGYGVGAPYIGEYAGISDWCPHNTYLQCLYFVGLTGVVLMIALLISSNGIKKIKEVNWFNWLPILALALYLGSLEFFSFRLSIYLIVSLFILTYPNRRDCEGQGRCIKTYKNNYSQKGGNSEVAQENERVLHLLASNKYSGAENVACQIINIVGKDKNIEFAYASPKGTIKESVGQKHIKYLEMEKLSFKELNRVVKQFHPTIIHAHDLRAISYATLLSKNIPVIAHVHLNHPKARKFSFRSLEMAYCLTRKKVKKIIWVSNSCLDDFKYKSRVQKKSIVITNIIDCRELIQKASMASEQHGADIVYLGRITYQKNPERFINIIKLLVEKKPDVKVSIIGDGDLMDSTKNLVKEAGLDKNIRFYGFLDNGYGILKNSKVFLLSSRYEGYPMCVLEAQSFGLPIVSPNLGELNNLVINGKTGFIYEDDDEAVKYIIQLLEDKVCYEKIHDETIKFSEEYNDVTKYKEKMLGLYENKG